MNASTEKDNPDPAPTPLRKAATRPIRKVAVLGAGHMGSRIAAHLANTGVQVVLLDVVPEGEVTDRSGLAAAGLEAVRRATPAAFFEADLARSVTAGNLEDDLDLLRDCDWIIEAVAEDLKIKKQVLAKIAPFRSAGTIVTTNTSGLPIQQIAEEMDDSFRRCWFGTHFFNPPRYMRLLEVIPTPDSDMALVEAIRGFADKRLGKTAIVASDTPNFIGNRIGIFTLMNTIRVMQAMDLTIEQLDALTGSVMGWPKSGTFRLIDMVGIDVLVSVAGNFLDRVRDERSDLALPAFIHEMLERKWLGDKTGQGFYKKVRGSAGEELRLGVDWKTLNYRPSERARLPALDFVSNSESLPERIHMLLAGDPDRNLETRFYWQILPDLWNYAAHRVGEVTEDIVGIDNAMRAGLNWELGPFELWDAAGFAATAAKMAAADTLAPEALKLLQSGKTGWYREDSTGRRFFDIKSAEYKLVESVPGILRFNVFKKAGAVIKKNDGASLIDLGDGIAAIEFHSKMNSIGTDILSLVTQSLQPDSAAVSNFEAFVIANDGLSFSAGANLMQLLLAIQEQEWEELDLVIRSFQKMTQAIKFCPRPVVAAPFNLCLGGGAEIALHSAARQAHAELYMGLVETGLGLLPAGGGCKEMLLRSIDAASAVQKNGPRDSVEMMDSLRKRFEMIALAKVSGSALEARALGYLDASDGITMNRDRLLHDAKALARGMADGGYAPPLSRTDIPAPGESILASLKMGVRLLREGEYISDHDLHVAHRLAYVLCGGKITPGTLISEQYLLDLEREAFLSLCGEKKTADRVGYTLKNGKPLRN